MNLAAADFRSRLLAAGLCLAGLAAGIAAGLETRAADDAKVLAQRRTEVETLGPAEKDRLRRKSARFVKLETQQQERLRQLNRELAAAPDAHELRGVMRRYHEWLKTLTTPQRAELLQAAKRSDERVQRVVKMLPLSKADFDKVDAWWWECYWERLPAQRKQRQGGPGKRRFVPGFGGQEWFRVWREKPLTLADFEKLSPQLSAFPRSALEAQRTIEEKIELVRNWWRHRPADGRGQGAPEQELVRFFSEELTAKERDELVSLPLGERNRKLRERYFRAKFPPPKPATGKSPSARPSSKPATPPADGADK